MRFLTYTEDEVAEQKIMSDRLMRAISLEAVAFTGRMEFHNGSWCGIYGTPDDLKLRTSDGRFFRVEDA
jgi:hypothetical protein